MKLFKLINLLVIFVVAHEGCRAFAASSTQNDPLLQEQTTNSKSEQAPTPKNNDARNEQRNAASSPISDIKPFQNQVGGHMGTFMKDSEGFLLKQIDNQKEIDFYEILQNTTIPELRELKGLVPRYAGYEFITMEKGTEGAPYIRIEDTTTDFAYPCVMDLKLGKQTWEPGVPYTKIISPNFPAEMREVFEFCIPGFQFYDVSNGLKLEKRDREFGRLMSLEQGVESLFIFVNGKLGLASGLVDGILAQLRKIKSWFDRQTRYHFYGSSLLITYDAQRLTRGENPEVRVRMIDFAHTIANSAEEGTDVNYANALERLIALFQNFLPENEQENSNNGNVSLPDGLKPIDQRILGHIFRGRRGSRLGMLQDSEGHLLKPNPPLGEIVFYDFLNATRELALNEMKLYIPSYYGTKDIEINREVIRFLNVENIFHGLELPCSMEVKIGRVRRPSWEPPETVAEHLKYVLTKRKWGFGIPGFAYYNATDGTFLREGKELGYRMLSREAVRSIYNFVNGEIGIKCGLVHSLLEKLQKIRFWYRRQKSLHFYDTSILMTYDAKHLVSIFSKEKESVRNDDGILRNLCNGLEVPAKVSMLNFNKVVPAEEKNEDQNYLFGLRKLIYILENLSELYAETFENKSIKNK